MNVISRRNDIVSMAISDYPNAKQEDRKKMHKSTYEQAYPNQEEKIISIKDLMNDRSLLNGK